MLLFVLLSELYFVQARTDAENCIINPDDSRQWPENPPIFTNEIGDFLLPIGDDDAREFQLAYDQVFLLGCPGSQFATPPSAGGDTNLVFGQCKGGDKFDMWTSSPGESWTESGLEDYGCDHQPYDTTGVTGECGPGGIGTEIQIEFDLTTDMEGEAVTITVCHDLKQSRTLWSRHTIWDEVRASDHGNNRPSFSSDGFFDYDVNNYYKMATQKETIAALVGSQELADKYVQDQSTSIFLARGHLAPNADFIFYSWMDSSFHFINVAPQWQCFNGRNWMYFEDNCRDFAIERNLDLVVYTGTSGVMQLKDVNDQLVEIYLYDGDKLPVPRYYWKILYDPLAAAGVAVIGINNPHLEAVPDQFIVCPPVPTHPILDTVPDPTNIVKGFMWACRVEDLASAFQEVPELPPMELLL